MAAIFSKCSLRSLRAKCPNGFWRFILDTSFGQQVLRVPLVTSVRKTERRKSVLLNVRGDERGGYVGRLVKRTWRPFCSRNKTEANGAPNIDLSDDPEVRSILDEIAQHFQEDSDVSSQTTSIRQILHDETRGAQQKESKIGTRHLEDKFSLYDDAEAPVILDVHEDKQTQERTGWTRSELCLQRGVQGVFDIEEFVDILLAENAQDVCVIEVDPALVYTSYLVVASGRSTRHLQAIAEFVNKLYKAKKQMKDNFVVIQGEDSKTWLAMDMGNIVLHLFLPGERARYDIEMLWSVGPEYDDLSRRPTDAFDDRLQAHLQYLDGMKPFDN